MKIIGLARIGNDPVLRYTPGGGDPCLSLSLAWNYGKKDEAGNRQTQWCDVAIWGKRAQRLDGYLKKGQLIMVTLSDPRIEVYTRRDQSTGAKMVASFDDMEFTGKSDGDADQDQEQESQQPAVAAPTPAPRPHRSSQQQPAQANAFDDDIPF